LRMEMADDVVLGAMLKLSGARCRYFASGDVHLVYTDKLGALARHMEKGGSILGFSLVRTAIACLAWFALDIGIPVAAIATGGVAAALGLTQLVLHTITHLILARQFGAPQRGALLWPLGVATGIAMLARSGVLAWARGGILWRGTRYTKAEVEAGRRWINGRIRFDEPIAAR
jgi:hypothetical protein